MSKEIFKNHKIINKRKINRKRKLFYNFVIILYLFFLNTLIECRTNKSKIHLKVKTNIEGENILSSSYYELVDEIYVNGKILDNETNIDDIDIHQELNITLIWKYELTSTAEMFSGCDGITEIDLSEFDASKVTNMSFMFYNCSSLTSLNFLDINTSNVKDMSGMFCNCSSLTSLNLFNFDTSNVENMEYMFAGCPSLSYLNLSNFDTTNVENMNSLFMDCSSLTSMNLSNFQISKDVDKTNMFYGCSLLSYLILSNFDDYEDNDILANIFGLCTSLEFLYFKSFIVFGYDISYETNITICTDFNDSYDSYLLEQEMICNYNFNNNLDGKRFKCYIYDSYNTELFYKYSCELCGINFYQIYNDSNNNDSYVNCYYYPNGYYLDLNNSIYKPNEINVNEIRYSILTDKIDNSIIESTSKEIIESTNKEIIESTNKEDNGFLESNTESYVNSNDINNDSINNFVDNILQGLNLADIDNGNDNKYTKNNLEFIFTSTENQKNNKDEKNITMDLGQCEYNIKKDYNISENDSLYILQIISEEVGMKIPKLEYEVYYPLNNDGNELIKLNLTSCKGTKIEISIKVEINDSLDKYNPKSEYYNDICAKATSESGTDINLKDRQNEYVNNNMSLCEENCEFIDYNYTNKKAICSCEVILETPKDYKIQFDKKDFFKSFIDIKNMFNLNIMKCYKTVLKIKELRNNYGFFIISLIFLFYFATLFIFSFNSFYKLKMNITKIVLDLKFSKIHDNDNIINNHIQNENKINNNDNNNKIIDNNNDNNILHINKKFKKNVKKKIKVKKKFVKYLAQTKFKNINEINDIIYCEKIPKKNNNSSSKILLDSNIKEFGFVPKNNELNIIFPELKDFEINSLEYEEALTIDKRNYFQYYFSLLKSNHPLTFSFLPSNDYNSIIIKMFLFFFSFSLDFTINALFFNDDTMHKIYEDKGKFNFLYQIPQIMYSTIISKIIDGIIRTLALSQDNIVDLKREKEKKDIDIKSKKLIRKLKIKFILYFIITFIILLFFLYYVTCFCGIYVNTQIHLIKDSLLSLAIGFLYPIIMFLIPGIFRISALRAQNKNREYIYKVSSFIENYIC